MTSRNVKTRRWTEEELGAEILHYLRRLTHAIDQHSSALARHHGLTGPQLAVLQTLARSGEGSTSELARRLSLSQPTVTGIVKRMVEKGLVTRRPSEWDRRVVLLSPTPEGEEVLAGAPPLLRRPFMERLARLRSRDQEQLLECLRQIVTMIEQPPFPQLNGSPRPAAGTPQPSPAPPPKTPSLESEPA